MKPVSGHHTDLNPAHEPTPVRLEQKVLELSALIDISRLLNSTLHLSAIADHILLTTMGRLLISKSLFLLRRENNQFEIISKKGLPAIHNDNRFHIEHIPHQPVLLSELTSPDEWFQTLKSAQIEYVIPVLHQDQIIGLLAYGKKINSESLLPDEIDFLVSVAALAASNIQNSLIVEELRSVNQKLDKKNQELHTLFDIGRGLQSSLDAARILKLLGYGLMGEMLINKYLILLRRNQTTITADQKGFAGFSFPSEIEHQLFSLEQSQRITDLPEGLRSFFSTTPAQAIIPMRSQDQTKGILLVGSRLNGEPFTTDDLHFLYTLGNQALLSLENAWLFEDSLERKRLEEELELARTIQKNLLPKTFPDLSPFKVYGKNIPSSQVGGDYFDVIRIDPQRYLLAIADVSGKGVPASLLMSNLQAGLLALSGEIHDLSRLVSRINNIIYTNTASDKFITLFAGILDCESATLTYVNAGHNPPYHIFPDGQWQALSCGGLILGMFPDAEYEQETIRLCKGETVILYTDGITEAVNATGELFEEKRLEDFIRQHHSLPVYEMTEALITTVQNFAAGTPQSDDITVLIVQYPH